MKNQFRIRKMQEEIASLRRRLADVYHELHVARSKLELFPHEWVENARRYAEETREYQHETHR